MPFKFPVRQDIFILSKHFGEMGIFNHGRTVSYESTPVLGQLFKTTTILKGYILLFEVAFIVLSTYVAGMERTDSTRAQELFRSTMKLMCHFYL